MTNQIGKWWNEVRSVGDGETGAASGVTRGRVTTWILLDVSGSMYGEKLIEAKKAVRAYVLDACPMGELVGLMTFSDDSRVITSPDNDASTLCLRVQKVQADGGTDLVPALVEAERRGVGVAGVRKVVIVTDGMTTRPDEALAAAERMKHAGWFFVTVGIPAADEKFLEKLRGPQGGGGYSEVEGLVTAMRDAARMLPPPQRLKELP